MSLRKYVDQVTKAMMTGRPTQRGEFISNTAVHEGNWSRVRAITATVIATMTSDSIQGTLTAITLPAGGEFEGHITSITLTSGTVMMYELA